MSRYIVSYPLQAADGRQMLTHELNPIEFCCKAEG